MSCVLACDLGGTSFRAALIDAGGVVRAESAVPCAPPTLLPDGGSELDPSAWWQALVDTCTHLAEAAPRWFDAVQAVAICGVTRSQVFLGADGQPLRRALLWNDSRATGSAARLSAGFPEAHPEAAHINAFHPLARLAWLRDEEAATFARLDVVLEPKDYLNFRLTRRQASDAISMARLLASARPANGVDLLGAVGCPAAVLPPLLDPCAQVGTLVAGHAAPLHRLAGVPVFCGSIDTWAAAAGLGALKPGVAFNISGTTEVLGVMSEQAVPASGLVSVDWGGLFLLGGPSQNGADTVRWLLSVLGRDTRDDASTGPDLEALLAQPRHPQPLLFLPYLQGERTPYWDPSLRGAFIGLHRQHQAVDLAHAVLEGVACLNRIVLERAEAALGQAVTEIRFGGGGALSPLWRQIKADVCERPVVVGAAAQPGVLGAALVAWTGLGRFSSLAQAQDELVKVAARHDPDPARRAMYRCLFDLYRRSEAGLADISHGLVALARQP